jgi:wobble nucleotide-excising tRNase
MIDAISLKDTASFGNTSEKLEDLRKVNYVFGSNGTGKTTISRAISGDKRCGNCEVLWQQNIPLEVLVYNRDFVQKHFGADNELAGVFTLGEKNVETLKEIEKIYGEVDNISTDIVSRRNTLFGNDERAGKQQELSELDNSLSERCWQQKVKYDGLFGEAFKGVRDSKHRFTNRVLAERKSNNAPSESLENLQKLAETVFGEAPETIEFIPTVNCEALIEIEENKLLGRKIIGKPDVDIAALIDKLGNSDWVRHGRDYLELSQQICPFCQQPTSSELMNSLEHYFDETFEKDTLAVRQLHDNYWAESQRIISCLEQILAAPRKFLDAESLQLEKDVIEAKAKVNLDRLQQKHAEPSSIVILDSLSDASSKLSTLISEANTQVAEHNRKVENLAAEREQLKAKAWRFVINELQFELQEYDSKSKGLKKAVESLEEQLKDLEEQKRAKFQQIQEMEKQITSTQPTIHSINNLLLTFGFTNFSLASSEKTGHYRLIRADGSNANETLSEGERTFITFLYFYNLIKGSQSSSGIIADRVVVFDDPVCSLDSDILFIVNSLIRGVIVEVEAGFGHVKQVFVLTHNVYFYKEVTFSKDRRNECARRCESFWTVRKYNGCSKVERHASNPIKTSYQLLWSELREPNRSNLSIQNTMRRILEYYFKILGGCNLDDICDKFEGKEKIVCRSLLSWVNDGSHTAHDDVYQPVDDTMIPIYKRVFKDIFAKCDHLPHYEMMMGNPIIS